MKEEPNSFHSFLATSADAFIEYSQEQKYVWINQAATDLLGIEATAIIGKNLEDLLRDYPDRKILISVISQIDYGFKRALRRGKNTTEIYEILAQDGSIKVYEIAYTPLLDSCSQATRVFGIGREITTRYQPPQPISEPFSQVKSLEWLNIAKSPLALICWDEQFRIIQWSKKAEEIFGWTESEAIGKHYQEFSLVYAEDLATVNHLFQQLLAGDSNTSINRNYTKNGQVIWCNWFNSVIRKENSFIILSWVEDITDRKRLEEIAEEQTRLKALIAEVGIALTRHPDEILHPCCNAIVEYLNVASAQIWTFNPAECILELQAWVGLKTRNETQLSLGKGKIGAIAQQRQPLFESGFLETDWEWENEVWLPFQGLTLEQQQPGFSHQTPDAIATPPVTLAGYPLIIEDRLVGVLAVVSSRSLTEAILETLASVADVIALGIERKAAEIELKSARGFLNSVVENLPLGIFAKDAESLRFVLWNKAGEAIAGFTSQEAIGKNDYDLFPKEQADLLTAQDREVLASFQRSQPAQGVIEELIQTRHRGLRILHTRKIPILNAAGYPQYILGIAEDITERKQVDESVRLYGQIVENMQIGLYVYRLEDINDDRTLRAIASNPASTLFTGIEMADILGMTLDEIFPHQREKGIPQAFASVIREQKAIELEDLDCDPHGKIVRAFSVKAFPLPNNCVGVAFENITARKQLELELQSALKQSERSEQLLRTVINATPDWIFAKDRSLHYILANKSFADALGRNVDGIIGKTDEELGFSPEPILNNTPQKTGGIRKDDIAVLEGDTIHNFYEPVTFADDSLHIFDTRKIPLRDAENNIFAILGFAHDITERYLTQEALHQKTSELEAVFQALPDLYFRLNANGVILDYLSGTSGDLDLPPTVVLGKQMADLLPAKVNRQFQEAIRETFQTGSLVTIEYSLHMPQGKQSYEARLLPFCETQVIILARNITQRKAAEAMLREKNQQLEQALQQLKRTQAQLIQAEKMSSLGQLVAGIAHEINNPVSFIYGNLAHAEEYSNSLLKLYRVYQQNYPYASPEVTQVIEEVDPEFIASDFPKLLVSMKMGADRIREIVLSLRNFARLEEAEIKTVDIHEGIDSTLLILQHRLKEVAKVRSIQIVKEYGHLPLVECYPGLLNQVLMNILTNAIDALSDGRGDREPRKLRNLAKEENREEPIKPLKHNSSPCIVIQTRVEESNRIAISISDNGPGIKDSVKSHLFDPFFTTKPVGKGTGLGLSISYQIVVEKHGGMLRCISALGAGAEFIIEIPVRQS